MKQAGHSQIMGFPHSTDPTATRCTHVGYPILVRTPILAFYNHHLDSTSFHYWLSKRIGLWLVGFSHILSQPDWVVTRQPFTPQWISNFFDMHDLITIKTRLLNGSQNGNKIWCTLQRLDMTRLVFSCTTLWRSQFDHISRPIGAVCASL